MNQPLFSFTCLVVYIVLTVSAAVHAQPGAGQVTIKGVGAMDVTRITASIEAVDQKNRIVTLKGPRGNVFAIPVSDRVKNLPQVKVGDTLEMDYYEALAIEAKATDAAPSLTVESAMDKAKPGEKPAGVALRRVHIVTNVLGINSENQSVLIRGPLGHLAEVKVKDPKVLAGLKNGGRIDLTYVEGLVLAVRTGKGS